MSSDRPRSGKVKRAPKTETDSTSPPVASATPPPDSKASAIASSNDSVTASTSSATDIDSKFAASLQGNGSHSHSTLSSSTSSVPPPTSSSSGAGSGKRRSQAPDKDSKREATFADAVENIPSGKSTRASLRLGIDKDKEKDKDKHKEKEKEKRDKKEKKEKEKEKEKDKDKEKEKDKDREKDKEKDKDKGKDAEEGESKPSKSPRKPRRSNSVSNLKKGHVSKETAAVASSSGADSTAAVSETASPSTVTPAEPAPSKYDDYIVSTRADDDFISGASSVPADGFFGTENAGRTPAGSAEAPLPFPRGSPEIHKRTSTTMSKRKSHKMIGSSKRVSKAHVTAPVPPLATGAGHGTGVVAFDLSSIPAMPSPSNRTLAGEILQYSLTAEGYWAEPFGGQPINPHIDELFAIQDERRDASLFPLQDFNNRYDYHTLFQFVPHINFIGIDHTIGPIIISITQEAFLNEASIQDLKSNNFHSTSGSSTTMRQSSKSNIMQRQTSEKAIKSSKQTVTGVTFGGAASISSVSPLSSSSTNNTSSERLNTGTTTNTANRAGVMFDTIPETSGGSSSSHSVLGSLLSPRADSQRNLKLTHLFSSDKSKHERLEKGDRQLSTSSLQSMVDAGSMGSHRALIRTKLGDVVALIPAIATKRKFHKGHALLNALIANQPRVPVPFDWEKVEFKEASLSKESIVEMELKLVPRHYKFGVIFAQGGQTTDDEFLNNDHGSEAFEKFMGTLAKKIELKGWPGFGGGLDTVLGHTGKYAYFTKFRDYDIMFHVSTCLPHVSGDDQQLEKKRHIGNDVVVIVFQDGDTPIAPAAIKSYFNHVFIIVHPIRPEETPKSDSPLGSGGSGGDPQDQPGSANSGHTRDRRGSTDSQPDRAHSDTSSLGGNDTLTAISDGDIAAVRGELDSMDLMHHAGSSSSLAPSSRDGIPPHSPSSPTILQRALGPERSGMSPSRSRSPIFLRTPRSNEGDSPAGSPPRSLLDFSVSGQQRSSSAVLTGTSPSGRGLHAISERASTPTRVPALRYNIDSRTQSAIVGQQYIRPESGEGSRSDSPAVSRDRRRYVEDTDIRSSSGASSSGGMRSPRIHDAAADDDRDSLPDEDFVDPVTAAATPSGGHLPPTWHLEHVVAATPRDEPERKESNAGLDDDDPHQLRYRSDSTYTDDQRVSVGGAGSAAEFDTPRSFGHDSEDHSYPPASHSSAPIANSHTHGNSSATGTSSSTEDCALAQAAPKERRRAGSTKSEEMSSKSGESGGVASSSTRDEAMGAGKEEVLPADSILALKGDSMLDEEDEESDKKRRLSRRLSMSSSKQLIKSSKSGKLVKAMPQITRAKLNVAAKERQAHPPVQYRIEVVCKDGVIQSDPKLPAVPVFNAGPYLREFLLTKLINAERAAYFSKHFSKPIERTRELMLQDMVSLNK